MIEVEGKQYKVAETLGWLRGYRQCRQDMLSAGFVKAFHYEVGKE